MNEKEHEYLKQFNSKNVDTLNQSLYFSFPISVTIKDFEGSLLLYTT